MAVQAVLSGFSESPSLFFACCAVAALVGLCLAMLDDSDQKGGNGNAPTSHLHDCAESADLLCSDLFSDGGGLGLLEPLWRLFTPEGALWTLVTGWDPRDGAGSLGVSGILEAIGSLFSAGLGLCAKGVSALLLLISPRQKADKGKDQEVTSSAHEKIKMTFRQEVHAYWGYLRLFCLGLIREYIVRARAAIWRDEIALRYVNREKWSIGWTDFYLQHMYKLYVDCFARPISSAPDATVDVVLRERPGGDLFGPLHDLTLTEKRRKCVNLSSYNYLGFGGVDEFCTPVARKAALELGWSTSGTRTEGGTQAIHRELENEVAAYLNKEDALVLGMGFATNSTILPALFEAKAGGKGMLVLSDELNHRSIVEGVRLSGATVRAFSHNHMPALEKQLKQAVEKGQDDGKPWRKIFVVVEGIYSMEGDFCRLREIVTLKNRYGAYLYLDEAHSIGAVGATGRGVTELLGVPTSEVDVMMGTFTKSFGSAGGYVAASKSVIAALRRHSPGSVFASAMAPPCAAQALQALRVISGKDGGDTGARKLKSIKDNANFFREGLDRRGFKVLGDVDSPIIPVMLHHPWKMAAFSRRCLDRGIAVVVVGNPAVPVLYERVRFCISAAHTIPQLAEALAEITAVGKELGVLYELATDKAELEARAAKDKDYAHWLRSAPVELSGEAKPAFEWRSEPLCPAASAQGSLASELEASCAYAPKAPISTAKEFRLMDPLGYGAKPLKAAQTATEETMDVYGFGACGPRGFYGGSLPHLELEAAVAKFLGTDAAIMYSAGVTTASSVIPAIVQPGDRVIIDSEVNLGFRTGLRLTKAEVTWVPHNDLAAVEKALITGFSKGNSGKEKKEARRTFIMTEALCQRTGQLAPLKELVALKEKYGALIVLDESLSFGVLGATGRGLCELHGVASTKVDAIIGSFEHATAAVGGFCAGRRGLVDHQRLAGAGYCFSASCPPSACSAAKATIEDLTSTSGLKRREQLRAASKTLHEAMVAVAAEARDAVELLSCSESFVQHLRWRSKGDISAAEAQLVRVQSIARSAGLHVQVCSPGLCGAEGSFGARLRAPDAENPSIRLCASTEHTAADIAAAAEVMKKAFRER